MEIRILLAALVLVVSSSRAEEAVDQGVIARIKMEGFQRSQVMETLFHLTDANGPRLHGSRGFDRAAEWSRDRLRSWGLSEVGIESFPSEVAGWELESYSLELLEPSYERLIGYPMAWTPGTEGVVEGVPVLASISSTKDLENYRGKLRGAIVLRGEAAPLREEREPSERMSEDELRTTATAIEPGKPRDLWEEDEEWEKDLSERLPIPKFFREEGVAAVLEPSSRGAGVVRVSSPGTYRPEESPPTFVLAREQYNRLARLVGKGLRPKLRISSATRFVEGADGRNVLAEISGTDPRLRAEVVLIGGHLDSWHSGTGATDNGAGCAVMMEAMRILKTIGARPRRTIRLGLWGGEEQDYWGSRYHVEAHYADLETMERKPGHELLSAYFNLDSGTGKIRGLYLQGNESVRPIFEEFLEPFAYLGASTLTTENTSGTDHLLFDAVGLPGFTFIQDPIEYGRLTHHTNLDVYDRVREEDLKQAAVLVASVAYLTAMRDEKLPRKPLPAPRAKGNK